MSSTFEPVHAVPRGNSSSLIQTVVFDYYTTRYNTHEACPLDNKEEEEGETRRPLICQYLALLFLFSKTFMFPLFLLISSAAAQINLGQFGFHPTGNGGWDLGLGQNVNIMGFGGDRGLKLGQGPQGFGLQTGGGALVAGQRVGVDSGLGVQPTGGVDLGSQLNFGNNNNPLYPGGQFKAFLDNIGSFFKGMFPGSAPLPVPMVTPRPPLPTLRPQIGTEGFTESVFTSKSRETLPKSGEIETMSAIDSEPDSVDSRLFERITKKPRQLPGLVEFGDE